MVVLNTDDPHALSTKVGRTSIMIALELGEKQNFAEIWITKKISGYFEAQGNYTKLEAFLETYMINHHEKPNLMKRKIKDLISWYLIPCIRSIWMEKDRTAAFIFIHQTRILEMCDKSSFPLDSSICKRSNFFTVKFLPFLAIKWLQRITLPFFSIFIME